MSQNDKKSSSQQEVVLSVFQECKTIKFDGERYIVENSDKDILEKYSVPYDAFGDHIRIQFKKLFTNEPLKYGRSLYSEVTADDILGDFWILYDKGALVYFNSNLGQIQQNAGQFDLTQELANLTAYYKLFNFLKDRSYCDYFNDANNEIVLYSAINGIFRITYDTVPSLSFANSIESVTNRIIEIGRKLEVAPFLKNSFFTIAKGSSTISLVEVISKAEDVILITLRDYELVSKQFDFEKFKDTLYREKEKYFTNVREIVNKISNQAVGLPISITATVFATYKVSGDDALVYICFLGFIAYVAFYIRIQLLYKTDLETLREDLNRDFHSIAEKSALPREIVNGEIEKIKRKLISSKKFIEWLIYVAVFLGLLVSVYSFRQLNSLPFLDFSIPSPTVN